MNILLINPPYPFQREQINPPMYGPTGLGYIAALLENAGECIEIIDLIIERDPIRKIRHMTKRNNYDIVGITALTISFQNAVEILKLIKNTNPETITVMGGPHATFADIDILRKYKEIDAIVRGEGEFTTLEIVKNLSNKKRFLGIKGVTYKENGKISRENSREFISNLDSLPFPARHLLPMKKYIKEDAAIMVTPARGCPYRCLFCCSSKFWGGNFRTRSIPNIIAEIKEIKEKYTDNIAFADDIFTCIPKFANDICTEILENKLNLRWICSTRVDRVNKNLVEKMKKSGCYQIQFGIESGSQKILNNVKKNITLKQAENAVRITKEVGIETIVTSFILGLPGETKETARKTLEFAKHLKEDYGVYVSLNILYPLPGTDIYDNAEKYNIKIENNDFSKYYGPWPVFETDKLSQKELQKLWLEGILSLNIK